MKEYGNRCTLHASIMRVNCWSCQFSCPTNAASTIYEHFYASDASNFVRDYHCTSRSLKQCRSPFIMYCRGAGVNTVRRFACVVLWLFYKWGAIICWLAFVLFTNSWWIEHELVWDKYLSWKRGLVTQNLRLFEQTWFDSDTWSLRIYRHGWMIQCREQVRAPWHAVYF